jgi:hypothetical protein
MCVPSDKQHAEIHRAYSKDKMEESIPIWYVIFRQCYVVVPELHIHICVSGINLIVYLINHI